MHPTGGPGRRLVLVTALLVATACGGGGGGTGGVDGDAVPPRAARPGELRVGAGEDMWPLYGPGARSRTFAVTPNMSVFETLVALNPDYTLKPALAERWEFIAPGTWRFHLRPGVTFHDGKPLTADDVVWTWTERQTAFPSAVGSTLGPGSVRKVDDLTVDFVPSVPNQRLADQVLTMSGAIVPQGKHIDDPGVAGTGPFRIAGYTPRREASVERYDGYWGAKPKIERLTVRFYPDPEGRLEALGAGEIDLALDVSPDDLAAVERDPALKVIRVDGVRQHTMFLNVTGSPAAELMADKAVRQAVMLAVDRNAYVAKALNGAGQPGSLVVPRAALGPAAAGVPAAEHDPAGAGRLLDGAGWPRGADGIRQKGGRPLTLTLIGDYQLPAGALAVVAEQLRSVGIAANVKRAEDRLTYDEHRLRPFDIDVKTTGQSSSDPSATPAFWLSSQIPEASAFAIGAPADALIEKARAARTPAELQQAAADLLRLAHEEAVLSPLADASYLYGASKAVDFPNAHPAVADWTQVSITR